MTAKRRLSVVCGALGLRRFAQKCRAEFIRFTDSLPRELPDDWLHAYSPLKLRRTSGDTSLAANPPPWDDITETCYHGRFSDKLDEHLDAAHGSCALREPRLAQIVADRLQHFDGQSKIYERDAARPYHAIMPNNAHVLFTLRDGESLADTLQGWKGVSSRLIHQTGLCTLKPFWLPDYFDRLIRSPEHFSTVKAYIRENPAKSALKTDFVLWEPN